MEKYFYFRKDATVANDDDQVAGSNAIKVSDLISMESSADGAIIMRFKPRNNAFAAGGNAAADADNLTDLLTLSCADFTQRTIMETILNAIAKPTIAGHSNLIVLFDARVGDGLDGITDVVTAVAAAQA